MRRVLVIVLSILVLTGLILPLAWPQFRKLFRHEELLIAAVGPQRGHGEEMQRGISLFLKKANQERIIPKKTIRLLKRDDLNQARLATKVASELVDNPNVLLVLGHYNDDTALAAGDVYQKYGLPAITASSIAEQVTHNNAWYFRTLPNSTFEGHFIVSYIQHILKESSLSIIYDNDVYGTALLESLRDAAKRSGMTIGREWAFDRETDNLQERLQIIISELRALQDPGAIFLATHETEGVSIIKTINNPGTEYTILGGAPFATQQFIELFNEYLQEQVRPGYYSDRVYVVTPYLKDIAPEEARAFHQAYFEAYRTEPSWIAAAYYDAARLAVEAMKLAEINTQDAPFKKRQKIRDVLAALSEPEVAINGVTNQLYFTSEGDMEYAPYVGRYTQQQLLPAYSQYQLFRDSSTQVSSLQQALSGSSSGRQLVSLGNGNIVKEVQIVNAGIDINNISNIDMRHARYMLDFYLWFRFRDDFQEFDDTLITFVNATSPVILGPPVLEDTNKGVTVRTYHVKGEFTHPVDLTVYPFDQPTLRISLHHNSRTLNNLRYVPDVVGMQGRAKLPHIKIEPLSGWRLKNISSYQRIFQRSALSSQSGQSFESESKLMASQFITDIHVIRDGLNFSIKSLYPLAVLIVCLYLVYFIPIEQPGIRITLCIAVLLVNFGYQYQIRQRFAFSVNYVMGIELLIFAIYGLGLLAIIFTWLGHQLWKRGRARAVQFFKMSGRVAHVVILGVIILWLMYIVSQQNGISVPPWLLWFSDFR